MRSMSSLTTIQSTWTTLNELLQDEPPVPMGTEESLDAIPWPPGWEDDDEDEVDPDDDETL